MAGGGARRPYHARDAAHLDPSPQAPPLSGRGSPRNGGEFLLELLRRPPQSSFSSPPIDAPHCFLRNHHHEDPVAGSSHSLSPPNIPPWLFPPVLPQPLRYSSPGFPSPDYPALHSPIRPQFIPNEALPPPNHSGRHDRSGDYDRNGSRQQRRSGFPQANGFADREAPVGQIRFAGFDPDGSLRTCNPTENGRGAGVRKFGESVDAGHGRGRKPVREGGTARVDGLAGRGMGYLDRPIGGQDTDLGKWKIGHHKEERNSRAGVSYPPRRDFQGSPSGHIRRAKGVVPSNIGLQVQGIAEAFLSDKEDEEDEDVSHVTVVSGDEGHCLEVRTGPKSKIVLEEDALIKRVLESLVVEEQHDGDSQSPKMEGSRGKGYRLDTSRGFNVSSQAKRYRKAAIPCRPDINRLIPFFLSTYGSLIPTDEEKSKQRQLLLMLQKLVSIEWPDAKLHLYGSCANSFGVSKSDIDVCLAINDEATDKSEILLRLADLLKSENFQNVQALVHARVPIVKLMDPITGISCDICVNNILAVVNTKLLGDYAKIDERLRQLAFIVKHWAKTRCVNETYSGTLSSYAYVLMCIHFLQSRIPAILPCLQKMEVTYYTIVEDVECAFFDRIENLKGFGSRNKESIAELVWAFFHYWAYCHDYSNSVISIRVGGFLSKHKKDWTRRIGRDRHLICIEDPFETSHDLGRVVDKFSIKILREEFERAADILQFDPDPTVTLFNPYVRKSRD